MLKLYTLNIPAHTWGKTFTTDFSMSGNIDTIVGAAVYAKTSSGAGRGERIGTASLSIDGNIVTSALPILLLNNNYSEPRPLNKQFEPIKAKGGNTLRLTIEENENGYGASSGESYSVKVFIKAKRK